MNRYNVAPTPSKIDPGAFPYVLGSLEGDVEPQDVTVHGVNGVAIHSHMAAETPRTLLLHYCGRGSTADLVKTLQAALDTQK